MFYAFWNTFTLVGSLGLLILTSGPQPHFHALIMLCTGVLGVHLLQTPRADIRLVDLLIYILLNFVALLLSPLQLLLLLYLDPKPAVDHGIVTYHDGDEDGKITVDIVAVHGLGSNPAWAWTWEDAKTKEKCMWLKDLLPKAFPRARIMAYNHNSAWFRDAPVKSVRVCGEQLLNALDSCRNLPQAVDRPIVFIGHSFGGIIIKEAMVLSNSDKDDSTYHNLERSVHGAIFLGVPHDGSQLTVWGKLLSYCTYWLGSSTELLEVLQSGAGFLRELNRDFIGRYGGRDLVDFFELHRTRAFGLPLLMGVDEHSSTNPGVKRIALEADHIGVNKFRAETDHNYELVRAQLRGMVDKIEEAQSRTLSKEQLECLRSVYIEGAGDRLEEIDRSHESTFQWVSSNPVLQAWVESKSQLVWVSGKPGSGKSTLSKFLLERMRAQERGKKGTAPITGMFFNDRGSDIVNSQQGFFHTLLYQLVEQKPSLYSLVPERKQDHTGTQSPLSLDALRDCLLSMLDAPEAKCTRFIIDALDECPEGCKSNILKFILEDLAKHPSAPQILVTSRQHADLEIFLGQYPTIQLDDLNRTDIFNYLTTEFKIYHRFHTPDFIQRLVAKAADRSQGVFLWVKLVVTELRKGKMIVGTSQELEEAIDSLPWGLTGFYTRILDSLDTRAGAETKRMLEWVLFAQRPLSLAEFRYAIAMGSKSQPSDLAAVEDITVSLDRMDARIREYSGGLLEVKKGIQYTKRRGDGRGVFVQLIHQSVKDFLLERKLNAIGPELPLIVPSEAHTNLSQICIRYLSFPNFDMAILGFRERNSGLWDYASAYWTAHAPLSKLCGTTTQMTQFGWPKRKNFRLWMYEYGSPRDMVLHSDSWETEHPLLIASQIGLEADVKHFLRTLERGFDGGGGERGKALSKSLVAAAYGGHGNIIELLLECDPDVDPSPECWRNSLHAAALKGHGKVVELLLKRGVDVNASGGQYGNALYAAVRYGSEGVVQLLLERGADINAQGGKYGTALQEAVRYDHEKVVQLLLDNKADINAQGGMYGSALHAAIHGRHERTMRLLLERGADVDTPCGEYKNALEAASRYGNQKIVQILFDKEANDRARHEEYESFLQVEAFGDPESDLKPDLSEEGMEYKSALHTAAENGNYKVVLALLEKGADPNTHSEVFGNILQAVAYGGHKRVAQLLIERGAKVNAQGGYYGNALQAAAYKKHDKVVQLLLEKGADPNAQGGHYGTPLIAVGAASVLDTGMKVAQLLLDSGANANAQVGEYGNALQTAAASHAEDIIELLIEHGADVNAKGGKYDNALHAASYVGCDGAVKYLLEKGADPNAGGGSLLQDAAQEGYEDIARMLVEHGADVNAEGGAIFKTFCEEKSNVEQLILSSGVDVNAQNGKYGNALQLAAFAPHEGIIQLLLENGARAGDLGERFGVAMAAGGCEKVMEVLEEQPYVHDE